MSIQNVYKLDSVIFPSSTRVDTLSNNTFQFGIKTQKGRAAGQIYNNFVGTEKQQPQLDFTSKAIDVILGLAGTGGAAGSSAVTAYLKQASATGYQARASTVHLNAVINNWLFYWNSMKLTHDGQAEVNCTLMANYDGTNDPFILNSSIALSGTMAATNYFGAGPTYINTVQVPGIQEIQINNNVKLIQAGGESDEFDTFIGIETCEPEIMIKTFQPTNWSQLLLRGIQLNGISGCTFFARKYLANGSTGSGSTTRVANATAQHIQFQAANGRAIPVDANGNESGPVSNQLKIETISTTDSTPLVATLLSTIVAPSS